MGKQGETWARGPVRDGNWGAGGRGKWQRHIETVWQFEDKKKMFRNLLSMLDPKIVPLQCLVKNEILHFNTYVWNLERWYWWTYVQGNNGDTDRENRSVDTGQGRRGWGELRE